MTIAREILVIRTHDNDNHCKRNNKNITIVIRTSTTKRISWLITTMTIAEGATIGNASPWLQEKQDPKKHLEDDNHQKEKKRKFTPPSQPPLPLPKIPTSWKIKTFIVTKVSSKIMKTMTIARRRRTRTPWIIAKK